MKKLWPILAMTLVLACQTVFFTPTATPLPTDTVTPSATSTATAIPFTETPTITPTPAPTFVMVRVKSRDGEFADLLYAEAQKAANLGLLPVIEFDATW
jgi:uncharacterized RDD family membrane protein YckC